MLLLGGYTFSQQHSKKHWYCSKKKSLQCKARAWLNDKDELVYHYDIHSHPPPQLVVDTKNVDEDKDFYFDDL